MGQYREVDEEMQARKTEEMRISLHTMIDNMEEMKAMTEVNAVLTRVAYDTLIKAGFTETEAFELVARKGAMLT